jgi:hypothetical protein
MRKLSLQRRKVVVLAGSLAAMSGIGPLLMQRHHYLGLVWIGCVAVMMVIVITQLVKLKREVG